MDSELVTATTKTKVMTYEEARKRLKEVEMLLNHHEPVRINCEELSEELTAIVGMSFGLASVPLGLVGMVLWSPFMLLLPVLPMAWVFARCYDGRPSSKISRFLSKILLTKKQRAIQSAYNRANEEYTVQREIFELFVQAKRDELINDEVFKVLHDGVQETYPWIHPSGKITELTPQSWRAKSNALELENKTRTTDILKELISKNKELISKNPELAQTITT